MNTSTRFIRLAVRCCAPALLLASAALCAQQIETVSADGIDINLTVPADYCKLTRASAFGKSQYDIHERMQTGKNRVLLMFVACDDLARIEKGQPNNGMQRFGVFMAPLSEGKVGRMPPSLSRAEAIAELAKSMPALNVDDVSKRAQSTLGREGVAVDKLVIGLLETDANAMYFGLAGNFGVKAAKPIRMWCVASMTLINHVLVSELLYSEPDKAAPFKTLLAAQKINAAQWIKAN